ncbi:MAG: sensor histidine kinase [Ferrimicrobium sp.]
MDDRSNKDLFDLWQICDSPTTIDVPTLNVMSDATRGAVLDRRDKAPSCGTHQPLNNSPVVKPTGPEARVGRTSLGVLGALERIVTLSPQGDGGSLDDLEDWLTRLLIAVRIAMVGFPLFALLAYWKRYSHPDIVAVAVSIAVIQGGVEVVMLRRGRRLGDRVLVPFDLVVSVIVAGIAFVGAGTNGRVHGLDGFIPYLMIIAGLVGVGYGLSWVALLITAIAGATWASLPLGRGAIIWNDEGGFLLWFIAGALVAATLRLFATRLDQAVAARIHAEKKATQARQERWIHDDLLDMLGRLAEGTSLPGDRRRAKRLLTQVRIGALDDNRDYVGLSGVLPDLVVGAHDLGITLELVHLLEGEPPVQVTEALIALLETLVGNIARHTDVSSAELAVRATPKECYASLSDAGCGFDPYSTKWSTHTKRLMADARAIELSVKVQSGPDGSCWELLWQA